MGPLSNIEATQSIERTVKAVMQDIFWPVIQEELDRKIEKYVQQAIDGPLPPIVPRHETTGGIICTLCWRSARHPIHIPVPPE